MKNPYFSVIIPTLNEEKYVPNLLNDLLKQSPSIPFEVIVVDANSDDQTKTVVTAFKSQLESLILLNSKQRNHCYQKNYGASKAHGKYLILIDADSRLEKAFMTRLYNATKKYQNLVFLPKVIPQEQSTLDDTLFALANYFIELSQIIGKPIPSAGCMIFERGFFNFIDGYKTVATSQFMYPDDHEIILRTRKAGVIARYLKDVRVKFSLRRLQKEGRLTVTRKYLVSSIEMLINGEMQTKANYEMGGQYYGDEVKKSKYTQKKLGYYLKKLAALKDQF